MVRDTFFVTLFIVLCAIGIIHVAGLIYFLYWKFWWLDGVSHFLGGFWAGGIVLWGYVYIRDSTPNKFSNIFYILLAISAAFLIGIWWEIYEVLIRSAELPHEDYFFDTIADLIADTVGAFFAGLYFLYLYYRTLKNMA